MLKFSRAYYSRGSLYCDPEFFFILIRQSEHLLTRLAIIFTLQITTTQSCQVCATDKQGRNKVIIEQLSQTYKITLSSIIVTDYVPLLYAHAMTL